MCNCKSVEMGSYDNTAALEAPAHMEAWRRMCGHKDLADVVCVDRCLENEIKGLWAHGITTTGCCCGHNKNLGYIGVREKDAPKMLELGYTHHRGCMYPETHFHPKSV